MLPNIQQKFYFGNRNFKFKRFKRKIDREKKNVYNDFEPFERQRVKFIQMKNKYIYSILKKLNKIDCFCIDRQKRENNKER